MKSDLLKKWDEEIEEMERTKKQLAKLNEPIYAADLLNMELGDQDWAVDKIIPNEGITIISGAPKSFKSWISLHIAMCIENGLAVFGKYQATQGGVLIIDEENHLRIIKNRLKMLGMNSSSNPELVLLNQKGFMASDPKQVCFIADLCDRLKINVVILDSLVRIHRSDENSSKDMSELFDQIKFLCQKGKTVIVLHHERKEGMYKSSAQSRMRGSSDISAVVDSHIAVKKDPKDKTKLTVEHAQSRCDAEEDPFDVRFVAKDGFVEFQYLGKNDMETKKSKSSASIEAIIDLLEDFPDGITHGELVKKVMETTDAGERTIRSAIKQLLGDGVIQELPGDTGNKKLLKLTTN